MFSNLQAFLKQLSVWSVVDFIFFVSACILVPQIRISVWFVYTFKTSVRIMTIGLILHQITGTFWFGLLKFSPLLLLGWDISCFVSFNDSFLLFYISASTFPCVGHNLVALLVVCVCSFVVVFSYPMLPM